MGTGLDCFLHFHRVVFSFLSVSLGSSSGHLSVIGAFFLLPFSFVIPFFKTVLNPRFFFPFVLDCFQYHLLDFILETFLFLFFGQRWLISLAVLGSAIVWETFVIMGQMDVCTLVMLILFL
ncbi:hypothetical protein GGI43DRAFT_418645 [Trichoderma evansii]